jgi:hypothetical protein
VKRSDVLNGQLPLALTCSDATDNATATAALRLALGSARRPYGRVPVVRYSAGYEDTGKRDSGVSRKRSKYPHEVFNTVSLSVASRSMPGDGSATEAGPFHECLFKQSLENLYPFFKTWGSGVLIFFT